MFRRNAPDNLYPLKEIPYEKWYTLLCKEQKLEGVSNVIIKTRAIKAMDRFLDKMRTSEERNAVYKYMVSELGEVDTMNKIKMTKLQKSYLYPLLPSICGYIAGQFGEDILRKKCLEFYNAILV